MVKERVSEKSKWLNELSISFFISILFLIYTQLNKSGDSLIQNHYIGFFLVLPLIVKSVLFGPALTYASESLTPLNSIFEIIWITALSFGLIKLYQWLKKNTGNTALSIALLVFVIALISIILGFIAIIIGTSKAA